MTKADDDARDQHTAILEHPDAKPSTDTALAPRELNILNKSDRRGGARPNSGPLKGVKYSKTLTKEAAREALRTIVLREMDALVAAQIAHAKGLKYLVTRDKKSGKFIRVTETMAKARLSQPDAEQDDIIEVWEKDPSVHAFTDLMNRALDKPKEQEQEIDLQANVTITWLGDD
jgi:hypothetical protein